MGRHADPEILKLIHDLKVKGESWGFIASDEFKISDGVYWVDLVWRYRESQSLFITFEFEKEENERLLKNLDKIFDTPSIEIEKPYHHFLIVFNGALSEGMKKIVTEKARRYNIHTFEDFRNVAEQNRLNEELERLRIGLPELITRIGKTDAANAIHDVLRGLRDVVPVLKIEGQPFPIGQSIVTSTPISISQTSLSTSPVGAFDSTKYEGFALIPIPREQFVITVPNTAISLGVVLMHKQQSDREIRLSFIGIELPCKMNFVLLKDRGGGGFDIRLDPDLADVVQLKKYEDLLREYDKHKSLLVKNMEGKGVMGADGISLSRPLSSDDWYRAVSDLAYIQEKTSQRIPCPKNLRIAPNDLTTINRIKIIMEKAEETLPIASLTMTMIKEQFEKLIEIQQKSDKIPRLSIDHEQYSLDLLGVEVPLGPVTWQLPDMIFREPLEEVIKRIRDIESTVLVQMTMTPVSSNETQIIFHKWKE